MNASRRVVAAGIAAVSAALVLAACSSGGQQVSGAAQSPASPSAAASFNQADVAFARQMIPHHQQAIQMARMAAARAASPQIWQLARMIEAEQTQEIQTMTGWLRAWGQPAPGPSGGMPGMGHGVPGMMTTGDMHRLQRMHGRSFDRMFLRMMIAHHEGAVEMARTEQAQGTNPAARRLARSMDVTQMAQMH